MPPHPRAIRQAAEAVREHARRQHTHLSREPDYGVVQQIEPLMVELQASGIVLDDEQMIITQHVRQYDAQVGIVVGDAVKVTLMWNGDWLVEHVISPHDDFGPALVQLTQAQYDALSPPDPDTLYVIVG